VNARTLSLVDPVDRGRLHELLLQVATGLGLPVAHEAAKTGCNWGFVTSHSGSVPLITCGFVLGS
jgi:hypothetical protein